MLEMFSVDNKFFFNWIESNRIETSWEKNDYNAEELNWQNIWIKRLIKLSDDITKTYRETKTNIAHIRKQNEEHL